MLSISSKSKYGLQAVLSLAKNYSHGLLQIKDISSKNNIPPQYLGQIFNLLVKADIINSVRGKNGGYTLSRDPSQTTVLEIIEILEGEIKFVEKKIVTPDAIHDLFSTAEIELREVFNVSLADLLLYQEKKSQVLIYDI